MANKYCGMELLIMVGWGRIACVDTEISTLSISSYLLVSVVFEQKPFLILYLCVQCCTCIYLDNFTQLFVISLIDSQ